MNKAGSFLLRKFFVLMMLSVPLLVLAQPDRQPKKKQVDSHKAQQAFFPENLRDVFLGMTYDQLKKLFSTDELVVEYSRYDSVVQVTKVFSVGSSMDELRQATFYFPDKGMVADVNSIPDESRLFHIVLEFEQEDARQFVYRFKTGKSTKGGLTQDGWKWTFKTSDGVSWVVTYDNGFFVTLTGDIKETPWKKILAE